MIVTKLRGGLPSSFIYVVLVVGQDPGRTEKYLRCYLDTVLLLKSKKPTIRNKKAYPKEVQAT